MIIYYSASLPSSLNCFNRAINQPLVRIAHALEWVELINLCHWRDQKLAMVGMFVFVVVVVF
jgi:hypothetical protein